jgi:hypothetical protein
VRIFPEMVLRNVLPVKKHAPLRLIHEPPHWPLFCVAILSFLIFAFMSFGPLRSKGLFITLKKRDVIAWEKDPWPDALEVYVRAPARFFINGQEVSWSDLHARLIEPPRRMDRLFRGRARCAFHARSQRHRYDSVLWSETRVDYAEDA